MTTGVLLAWMKLDVIEASFVTVTFVGFCAGIVVRIATVVRPAFQMDQARGARIDRDQWRVTARGGARSRARSLGSPALVYPLSQGV